jgi:predicted phosphodiesterase
MKIVVVSDLHYPNCDLEMLREVVERESPSVLVLLGDVVVSGTREELISKLGFRGEIVYVQGDEDAVSGDTKVYRVKVGRRDYVMMHGHQFMREESQYSLASFFKRIHDSLPPLLFCLYFRMRLRLRGEHLVLGHSHSLRNFRSLKCTCAGTMSKVKNIYNDLGYVVVDESGVRTVKLKQGQGPTTA